MITHVLPVSIKSLICIVDDIHADGDANFGYCITGGGEGRSVVLAAGPCGY